MEAFGRISHLCLCEVDTDAVLGHGFGVPRRGATTGVLDQTVQKTVWRSAVQFGHGVLRAVV